MYGKLVAYVASLKKAAAAQKIAAYLTSLPESRARDGVNIAELLNGVFGAGDHPHTDVLLVMETIQQLGWERALIGGPEGHRVVYRRRVPA